MVHVAKIFFHNHRSTCRYQYHYLYRLSQDNSMFNIFNNYDEYIAIILDSHLLVPSEGMSNASCGYYSYSYGLQVFLVFIYIMCVLSIIIFFGCDVMYRLLVQSNYHHPCRQIRPVVHLTQSWKQLIGFQLDVQCCNSNVLYPCILDSVMINYCLC